MIRDDYGGQDGWRAVAAGALGCAVGAGVIAVYAFGVFLKPISAENGWPRAVISTAIALFYFSSGLGSLSLGSIISKFGPRLPTALGVALFGLGLCSIALLPLTPVTFCGLFALLGFFASTATAQPYAIVVCSWFDRRRGFALALMVAGTGVGSSTMSFIANRLLEGFGWRGGYLGLGLLCGLVALLASAVVLPALRTSKAPVDQEPIVHDAGPSFWSIWSDWAFWLIALPVLFFSIALLAVLSFMVPMLTDRGVTPAAAAGVMSVSGLASWGGRIACSILLDRIRAPALMAFIFGGAALGCLIIAVGFTGWPIYAAAILLGSALGTEADLLTFAVSRYFSAASYSKALGSVWIFWAWGAGIGSFGAGFLYDLAGSYAAAAYPAFFLAVVSAILIRFLGPYRFPLQHSKRRTGPARSERSDMSPPRPAHQIL